MAGSNLFSLLFCFILLTAPPSADSLSFSQFRTLLSLAHSLTIRVANLRASRGYLAGESRARFIAKKLERGLGLGFWRVMWNVGRDYLRNYAWKDLPPLELRGVVSDVDKLVKALNDLTRLGSESEKAEWMRRNYRNVLSIFKSLFGRLLKVFYQSGPLRGVVEDLQKEMVEGDLLRDCIEIGSNDLKGLLQMLRDMAS